MYGQAKVYGLHVSGNMGPNLIPLYPREFQYVLRAWVKITDIVGWVIVIDNGEGANANGPDLVSLIVSRKVRTFSP